MHSVIHRVCALLLPPIRLLYIVQATKASASCNATTVDAFCAKLNFKPVIQAVKQVSGSSNITSGRMWVAQHLDSINKAVVDLINTAIDTYALSSSTV